MQFKKQFDLYKVEIEKSLKIYFNKRLKEAKPLGTDVYTFVKTLSDYTQAKGAKRIRGILTLVGYELFQKKRPTALLDISCAFELIHSYLLIHDDIIDKDDFRRSQPTVHKVFEKKYKKLFKNNAAHIGTSLAIILGDTADAYAIDLVVNSKFTPEQKSKVISLMYHNIQKTVYGQFFDVLGCQNEKQITWMNQYKTALYTFVNPLLIGATLAGAKPAQLKKLESYGHSLGIAFQIQDDIIGLFGDSKVTGKPVGSDLRERRNTLLMFETRKRLKGKDYQKFNKIWNKNTTTLKDISDMQDLVAKSGAFTYNQATAKKLANKAKNIIKKLSNVNLESKHFLLDLADFVVIRSK